MILTDYLASFDLSIILLLNGMKTTDLNEIIMFDLCLFAGSYISFQN